MSGSPPLRSPVSDLFRDIKKMTINSVVPFFLFVFVMPYTEKDVCCGSVVSPSDTCSSYENARLRLENLRQSIKNWMEATIRSEFPEATKTRSRLRKLPHGRVRYCASVRSHGIYLSFSTYSLTAFSAAVTRAGAKHRIHHNTI